MDLNYYAHKKNNNIYETLAEHTDKTCFYFDKLCSEKDIKTTLNKIYKSIVSDTYYKFFDELISGIPKYHDCGKINPLFQQAVMENKDFERNILKNDRVGKSHSFLSALSYINYFYNALKSSDVKKEDKPIMRYFIVLNSYIISRHHSYLCDLKEYIKELQDDNINEILCYLQDISKSFSFSDKKLNLLINNNYNKIVLTDKQSIDVYIYVKLMYSLLVAADYYATSDFMCNTKTEDFGNINDLKEWQEIYENTDLMKGIRKYQKTDFPKKPEELLKETNINVLRTELLLEAESNLSCNDNIFYLEAPTGSGKSNTALDLTFKLIEYDNTLNKLFYIYPFNTLVEQNINAMKKIFGDSKEVFDKIAVVNSMTPIKFTDNECEDIYQRALLDRQFLNYPMILTTHVSLFQTIFGTSKNSVFGFHQLCNSVIVLDEVQSYKNSIWGEMISFLKELSSIMNIKIIIMSATLPDLDLLTGDTTPTTRLISDRKKYFEHPCFKNRVNVSYELMDAEENKLAYHIKNQINKNKKILVEFITKKSAEKFCKRLKEENNISKYVEFISGDTNIADRKRILTYIGATSSPVVLVATQVVEAGVDIDMDVGYKNVSKLDSEEQFLGRINRSCKKNDCIAYFFKIDESESVYKNEIRTNKELTIENDNIKEVLINKDFKTYYKQVLDILYNNKCKNNAIGYKYFYDNFRNLNFSKINKDMQLIEDDDWNITVFIAKEVTDINGNILNGKEIWNEYKKLLNNHQLSYAEKIIRLSEIKSYMTYFIHQVKKYNKFKYDEQIRDIYYICE